MQRRVCVCDREKGRRKQSEQDRVSQTVKRASKLLKSPQVKFPLMPELGGAAHK